MLNLQSAVRHIINADEADAAVTIDALQMIATGDGSHRSVWNDVILRKVAYRLGLERQTVSGEEARQVLKALKDVMEVPIQDLQDKLSSL